MNILERAKIVDDEQNFKDYGIILCNNEKQIDWNSLFLNTRVRRKFYFYWLSNILNG